MSNSVHLCHCVELWVFIGIGVRVEHSVEFRIIYDIGLRVWDFVSLIMT